VITKGILKSPRRAEAPETPGGQSARRECGQEERRAGGTAGRGHRSDGARGGASSRRHIGPARSLARLPPGPERLGWRGGVVLCWSSFCWVLSERGAAAARALARPSPATGGIAPPGLGHGCPYRRGWSGARGPALAGGPSGPIVRPGNCRGGHGRPERPLNCGRTTPFCLRAPLSRLWANSGGARTSPGRAEAVRKGPAGLRRYGSPSR